MSDQFKMVDKLPEDWSLKTQVELNMKVDSKDEALALKR